MNIVVSILVVIVVLGVIATVHELAHFFVARLLKIKAFEVSIFVGPKLIKWKRNDVDFSIRLIPVGAYVRFSEVDEQGYVVESDDPALLVNQPRFKRLLVSLAGPLVNLILGIAIFFAMFWATGFVSADIGKAIPKTQTEVVAEQFTEGDTIVKVNGARVYMCYDLNYELDSVDPTKDLVLTLKSKESGKLYDVTLTPVIRQRAMLLVTVESLSTDNEYNGWKIYSVDDEQNNGNPVIKPGDYITKLNDKPVTDEDIDEYLFSYTGETMDVTYYRDGEEHVETIAPRYEDYVNSRGIQTKVYYVDSPVNFFKALAYAAKMPASMLNFSIRGIRDAIAGKVKAYNLVSGPIGITSMVNEVVEDEEDSVVEKIYMLIMLSGIISIALAFSNLLPIPGLDGVQILLIVVEMVIGRKLSEKAEARLTVIGFIMIILLLILAFVSDILTIIFGYG